VQAGCDEQSASCPAGASTLPLSPRPPRLTHS
jgi:hypothetical protein